MPNTIDVEMDAEGVTRDYVDGKEETGIHTAPDSHDALPPETEISPTAPTKTPKGNKNLKQNVKRLISKGEREAKHVDPSPIIPPCQHEVYI